MAVLMPWHDNGTETLAAKWRWRLLAACLILGAAGLHLAYLACDCPLDLAPDEAHYWDWSRHLDWSYYSKGPLVAYIIRAADALLGDWSRLITGNAMLAIRLPAVVCGSLLLISWYLLTVQVFHREGLACAVVALALTLPPVAVGSSLMTIDAPYTCCWGWALVLGYHAVTRSLTGAWLAAGLVTGIGILAKYTMILWIPSVALFLLTSQEHRRQLFRPGFWLMVGTAAFCCLPIVLWNWQHDWVSLRHVNRLAGQGNQFHWEGPVVYLGTQFGLFLGFWFVAWVAAMIAHRPWRESNPGIRYLWWLSAPMFVNFLLFSVKTGGGEPNWPVTAYLSGLVLTGFWLRRQLQSPRQWYRRLTLASLACACGLGLVVTMFAHCSNYTYPLLVKLAGPPTPKQPLPLRRLDPSCRLRGWRTLAAAVDNLRLELQNEGVESILVGTGWALPGELGFYCQGRPAVYSFGPVLGDRRSQYDFWHPNPVDDPERFLGQTFILIGGFSPDLRTAFQSIDPPRVITHSERGYTLAQWSLTVCRGYRGLPHSAKDSHQF